MREVSDGGLLLVQECALELDAESLDIGALQSTQSASLISKRELELTMSRIADEARCFTSPRRFCFLSLASNAATLTA